MAVSTKVKEKTLGKITRDEKAELQNKIVGLLLSKERKGWKEDEMKKDAFADLSRKFGVPVATIKNYYYTKVMPVINEEVEKKGQRTATLTLVKNDKELVAEQITVDKLDEIIVAENKTETVLTQEETEIRLVEEQKKTYPPVVKHSLPPVAKPRELDNLGRPLRPPYKINDIIEVKVDHIKDYGVFCITQDEYEYKGLLHISEIKDIFISDANDYFEIGEIIKAKVILAQPERLNFSTREMKIQMKKKKEETYVTDTLPKNPPLNTIGEKFGKQLQSLTTYAVSQNTAFKNEVDEILKEDEANIDKAEIEALFAEQIKEEEARMKQEEANDLAIVQGGEIIPSRVSERDLADVQVFLNNKIGALSPNAQNKLVQILDKMGMFKSTMAISKVQENFVVDYGLIFMEMVSRELEKDEYL
jgi:general stress protein 13